MYEIFLLIHAFIFFIYISDYLREAEYDVVVVNDYSVAA